MWTRVKRLGEGGFGFVSLAKSEGSSDVGLDLPPLLAVKSAEFSKSGSLQYERELLHEFRECSNIIHCYGADASEEDGVILYNMMLEYAAGGCLVDRIYCSKQVLPDNEVKEYTKSVLMGLSFIHSKGFAHCDLKPGNILLVDDGGETAKAKICDFGLAKLVRKTNKRRKGLRGTLLYVAPESIMYGEYGCEVDIWALGCTVLEMILKKPLWNFNPKAEGVDRFFERVVNREVQIPHGMSRDAKDFLRKCLIKNPKLRWTADMLLRHPFVTSLSRKPIPISTCSEASTLSSLRSNNEEDMLLRCSFIPCSNKEIISIGGCSEASTLSSSRSINNKKDIDLLIRPTLLLNARAARLNRAAQDSVSEDLGCKRLKRMDSVPENLACKRLKRMENDRYQWPRNANARIYPAFFLVGAH